MSTVKFPYFTYKVLENSSTITSVSPRYGKVEVACKNTLDLQKLYDILKNQEVFKLCLNGDIVFDSLSHKNLTFIIDLGKKNFEAGISSDLLVELLEAYGGVDEQQVLKALANGTPPFTDRLKSPTVTNPTALLPRSTTAKVVTFAIIGFAYLLYSYPKQICFLGVLALGIRLNRGC